MMENFRNSIPALGIIIILIITGTLWFIFFGRAKAEEAFGKITPVKIETSISADIKVENNTDKLKSPKIPNIANVYERPAKIKQEDIVRKLGFSGEPQKVSGRSLWRNGTKSLIFTGDKQRFSYNDSKKITKGNYGRNQSVNKASEILLDLGIIRSNEDVPAIKVDKLFGGEERLTVYSISFGMFLESYPVVDENGNTELLSVRIGEDGTIINISANLQPLITKNSSTYKIKSLKQMVEELNDNKGSIVNISGPLNVKSKQPFKISYRSSKFGYLLSDSKYLQPVMIFKGEAFGKSEIVEVKTLISALEEKE